LGGGLSVFIRAPLVFRPLEGAKAGRTCHILFVGSSGAE